MIDRAWGEVASHFSNCTAVGLGLMASMRKVMVGAGGLATGTVVMAVSPGGS